MVLRRLGACSSRGGFSSGDHLIVGTIAQPQRAMGTIVKDVKVLLESNPKWPFYFIPNSTNRVTHALASCTLNNCFFNLLIEFMFGQTHYCIPFFFWSKATPTSAISKGIIVLEIHLASDVQVT